MSDSAAALQPEASISITLPDGSVRTYASGTTGLQIAESIAKSLAKAAIAIKINDELSDLSLPITRILT